MLTVVAPVLNEIDFIKAWCECVSKIADEVVVMDMGSTDGTVEVLQKYPFRLLHCKQQVPYSGSEASVRNELARYASCEWIMRLDADELIKTEEMQQLRDCMQTTRKHFIWIPHYQFWLTPQLIRARQFDRGIRDAFRFHPVKVPIVYRNIEEIKYFDIREGWNPRMTYRGFGKYSPRLFGTWLDSPGYYHYHYCHPKSYQGYRDKDLFVTGIKCMTYHGSHPKETDHYQWFMR